MASEVVADSGIFLASLLKEFFSKKADRLTNEWRIRNVEVVAPTLMRYEVISVLRKNVFRGILSKDEAPTLIKAAFTLLDNVRFEIDDSLLRRAYELAEQHNPPNGLRRAISGPCRTS